MEKSKVTATLWRPSSEVRVAAPDWSHLHIAKHAAYVPKSLPTAPTAHGKSLLLSLPLEIRRMIWRRTIPYHVINVLEPDAKIKKVASSDVWVSGSVAIFRVSKQVYNEAMPIVYQEECFTVCIQPRYAFLEFHPTRRDKQPKFGLAPSSNNIDINSHPGLRLVTRWRVVFLYHSAHGKRNKFIKCFGLQCFLKWLPPKPLQFQLTYLQRQNGIFAWAQMIGAFLAGIDLTSTTFDATERITAHPVIRALVDYLASKAKWVSSC